MFDGYLNVLAKDTSTGLGSMIIKEAILWEQGEWSARFDEMNTPFNRIYSEVVCSFSHQLPHDLDLGQICKLLGQTGWMTDKK
jgi:hypothetical protein